MRWRILKRAWIILVILLFALLLSPIVLTLAGRAVMAMRLRFGRLEEVTATKPLPNGGTVLLHGTRILNTRGHLWAEGFFWTVSYRPPEGSPVEFAGTFIGEGPQVTAAAARDLIIVIPMRLGDSQDLDCILVRSKQGRWRMFRLGLHDLADGLDPPTLSSVSTSLSVEDLRSIKTEFGLRDGQLPLSCFLDHFLANRAEFRLGCAANKTGGKLQLRLSDDGERMELLEATKYEFKN